MINKKIKHTFLIGIAILTIGLIVAVTTGRVFRSEVKPVEGYQEFIEALANEGVDITDAGEVQQEFFSPQGKLIDIAGENVQVFEYPNSDAANKEAMAVSSDGSSIGGSNPLWTDDPHFYRGEKIIVLYVGNNENTTSNLEEVLGPEFAGSGVVAEGIGYLEGQVTVGPVCPVVGPGIDCEIRPEVYTSREVVAYSEGEIPGGPEIEILISGPTYRTNLNEDGSYSMELPAGIYVINHGMSGVDSSSDLPKEIEIREGETTILDFNIDTGIR